MCGSRVPMIRRWLAQVSECRAQWLLLQLRKLVPSLRGLLIPLSSFIYYQAKQANANVLSLNLVSVFNTQFCSEPMLLQLLSKSRRVLGITAVVRCPGCPNPQSTPTHSFVAGPPAPAAECPTPYQDPCSSTPQGPTLLTPWLHPHLWLILGVQK